MTLIVALRGRKYAAIGSDRVRFESRMGDHEEPVVLTDCTDKVYHLRRTGALAGNGALLNFGGRTVKDWMTELDSVSPTVDDLMTKVKEVFAEQLMLDESAELRLRVVDLLIVPNPKAKNQRISFVRFGPKEGRIAVTLESQHDGVAMIGDKTARHHIQARATREIEKDPGRNQIVAVTKSLVASGIANCGYSTLFPKQKHCQGEPYVLTM